jgi:hypothetical protein
MADLNIRGSHKTFGEFDIVSCYGTLSQLEDPALCIKELSKNCRELFLLETCVNPDDNGHINCVKENAETKNRGTPGNGCRPARDWVIHELKKYYPFVYCSKSQPNHPDFPLRWPVLSDNGNNRRAVFIAARKPLPNTTLSSELLAAQKHLSSLLIRAPKANTVAIVILKIFQTIGHICKGPQN